MWNWNGADQTCVEPRPSIYPIPTTKFSGGLCKVIRKDINSRFEPLQLLIHSTVGRTFKWPSELVVTDSNSSLCWLEQNLNSWHMHKVRLTITIAWSWTLARLHIHMVYSTLKHQSPPYSSVVALHNLVDIMSLLFRNRYLLSDAIKQIQIHITIEDHLLLSCSHDNLTPGGIYTVRCLRHCGRVIMKSHLLRPSSHNYNLIVFLL